MVSEQVLLDASHFSHLILLAILREAPCWAGTERTQMVFATHQCYTPSKLRLGCGVRRRCNPRVRCCKSSPVVWNGDEPVPQKHLTSSVTLHRPCQSVDGLALFKLCQSWPDLKQLKVSAASFNSPVQGQWDLQGLQKLHFVFDCLSDEDNSVEQFLQHADQLYLEELRLSYVGPGFARLHAASLAKLHVDRFELEGFELCKSGKLAHRRGRLLNCVLDVSPTDFAFLCAFNNTPPHLMLERCRAPTQTFSWRILAFFVAVIGLLAVLLAFIILHPFTSIVLEGLFCAALYIVTQFLNFRTTT